jgi:phosphonopyruvate decarboxylase
MIEPKLFYDLLLQRDVNFFTGVPDSLLKNICAYITDKTDLTQSIIAANEGNAIGLASGYHLATGKTPLVYMQNSGIGNAVNPLLSLAADEVYGIPIVLMIGWRGEPGVKDEPQHVKQGAVMLDMLDAMNIDYAILPDDMETARPVIEELIQQVQETKTQKALIVRKNTFDKYVLPATSSNKYQLSRENAIQTLLNHLDEQDIIVSTTGKASRELFESRATQDSGHQRDFLTVGSMGHANQIALGIALKKPNRTVYCFDGDGAALMHTGGLGIIGICQSPNYKHILFNNGAHESVGGQPTIGLDIELKHIAEGFNYNKVFQASSIEQINEIMPLLKSMDGPVLLEIQIASSSRSDLGRPTIKPIDNKIDFMRFLED